MCRSMTLRDPAGDPSGTDFFFYDISWVAFCNGEPDLAEVTAETGVAVQDLTSLRCWQWRRSLCKMRPA